MADGDNGRVADGTGAWYISPLAQYTFLDSDRSFERPCCYGMTIAVGMNFAPNWAAEVNGSIGSFKIPNSGASQQLDAYSLDVLYKFLPDSIFRPYLVAGGGGMLDRVAAGLTDHHAGFAEAGAGLSRRTGPQRHIHAPAISRRRKVPQGIFGGQRVQSEGSRRHGGERRVCCSCSARRHRRRQERYRRRHPSRHLRLPLLRRRHRHRRRSTAMAMACLTPSINVRTHPRATASMRSAAPSRMRSSWSACISQPIQPWCCRTRIETLDYGVATLKRYPQMVIEVRGHTDSTGSKPHNQVLSQRRAESVKMRYLKEHGVTNSMTAKGYGEELPIASNKTAAGRQQNRRVSLRIVGGP